MPFSPASFFLASSTSGRPGSALATILRCGVEEAVVPSLILQPLVKNAIRYGIAPFKDGGRVEIQAARGRGQLVLEPLRGCRTHRDLGLSPGPLLCRRQPPLQLRVPIQHNHQRPEVRWRQGFDHQEQSVGCHVIGIWLGGS